MLRFDGCDSIRTHRQADGLNTADVYGIFSIFKLVARKGCFYVVKLPCLYFNISSQLFLKFLGSENLKF
ncbi:MAG: hypothetical protein A2Y12_13270 [Planctomycetes bacterium GWF2_42_9]|nr:MAG: hypothetical protein A2Y12_13270 [Planctomycetes bacterium GWF2_42_9]